MEHEHGHGTHTAAQKNPPPRDPVCGMVVNPNAKHQLAHAGEHYFFC